MNRTTCGSCASSQLDVFLDLGETPLANRYPATADEKEVLYPLQLGVCESCGLVQMMALLDDHDLYGVDYGFYSGASQAQRDYHRRNADLLMAKFPDASKKLTIEVACNDGSLLEHFVHAGCKAFGIDPAQGPVKVAHDKGLFVVPEALTTRLAQALREEHGPAGLVIANNSMAHVGDLSDVLTGVRTLMDNASIAVFEMQYLPDLLAGNMYDQVYHEHRFFYSVRSLRHAAQLRGLYMVDVELIELQGGGMRAYFSADPSMIPSSTVMELIATERWLQDGYRGFQGQVDRTKQHLLSLLNAELAAGRTLAGYGAAAKATTIMNFCDIGPEYLEYVVDTTPYKQGRFVPGTGVPIVPPEHATRAPTNTLLLLAANYLGTVLRNGTHPGRWIVPQPLPMALG